LLRRLIARMALCPGDTTEWDDIHRRMGNFAPREREVPQREVEKAMVEALEQVDVLDHCSLKELDCLEDDVEEDVLAKYRRKRLAEMKAASQAAKFGDVQQVTRCNFVATVTEASRNGQWVLVLLYVEANYACHYMEGPWERAARRFPAVKFLRGVASEVIPEFPDGSTPAVVVYRDAECQKQILGLEEWGGTGCSVECVEWVLARLGVVGTELEDDPRQRARSTWSRPARRGGARDRGGSSAEEEEEEEEEGGEEEDVNSKLKEELLESRKQCKALEEERNILQNVLEWKEVQFRTALEDMEQQLALSGMSTSKPEDGTQAAASGSGDLLIMLQENEAIMQRAADETPTSTTEATREAFKSQSVSLGSVHEPVFMPLPRADRVPSDGSSGGSHRASALS